jgi:hypothetical protein
MFKSVGNENWLATLSTLLGIGCAPVLGRYFLKDRGEHRATKKKYIIVWY